MICQAKKGGGKMKIDLRKIEKLIKRRDVAFISSLDEVGFPNTKAMLSPRKIEGLKTFYFFIDWFLRILARPRIVSMSFSLSSTNILTIERIF